VSDEKKSGEDCRGGYEVRWCTVNSVAKTAQRRNRLYIVGFRRDVAQKGRAATAARAAARAAAEGGDGGSSNGGSSNGGSDRGEDFFQWPAELGRGCDAGIVAADILETVSQRLYPFRNLPRLPPPRIC
jgi:hypothetical protein